jgi:hypothetical protein
VKVLFVAPGYHPRVGGVERMTNANRMTGYNDEAMITARTTFKKS